MKRGEEGRCVVEWWVNEGGGCVRSTVHSVRYSVSGENIHFSVRNTCEAQHTCEVNRDHGILDRMRMI